jgi:hypothetical protein
MAWATTEPAAARLILDAQPLCGERPAPLAIGFLRIDPRPPRLA